ncbi:hypothetical protein L7F22_018694 [Adiantum nelumboides]|nr:hypothetical protein [Adiantum nelumboides]
MVAACIVRRKQAMLIGMEDPFGLEDNPLLSNQVGGEEVRGNGNEINRSKTPTLPSTNLSPRNSVSLPSSKPGSGHSTPASHNSSSQSHNVQTSTPNQVSKSSTTNTPRVLKSLQKKSELTSHNQSLLRLISIISIALNPSLDPTNTYSSSASSSSSSTSSSSHNSTLSATNLLLSRPDLLDSLMSANAGDYGLNQGGGRFDQEDDEEEGNNQDPNDQGNRTIESLKAQDDEDAEDDRTKSNAGRFRIRIGERFKDQRKLSVTWLNLREEPVVYINGKPYCLRQRNMSLRNLKEFSGISWTRLNLLEERLRNDILNEIENGEGRILLHNENDFGEVFPVWEEVRGENVETIQEDDQVDEFEPSIELIYRRIPITAEKPPDFKDIEELLQEVLKADIERSPIILNCQLGRGRSTLTSIIVLLIERWLRSHGRGRDFRISIDDSNNRDNSTNSNPIMTSSSTAKSQSFSNLSRSKSSSNKMKRKRQEKNQITFETFVKKQPVFDTISKEFDKVDEMTIRPLQKVDPADGMALDDEVQEVVQNRKGSTKSRQGRVLLHDEVEVKPGNFDIIPVWETVQEGDVLTPREVYEMIVREGYKVDYARVAVTDEQAPVSSCLLSTRRASLFGTS